MSDAQTGIVPYVATPVRMGISRGRYFKDAQNKSGIPYRELYASEIQRLTAYGQEAVNHSLITMIRTYTDVECRTWMPAQDYAIARRMGQSRL